MVLFFMIPVAAIQALIQAPTLSGSGAVQKAPLKQIFQAIIPGLALKIFLAIVPLIIRVMMYFAGATSQSEIDFGVTKRFFLFQVVAVFFGSVISGAFFNQLKQWIDDPGSVIPILGKAIPMNATFFLTYLLINGLLVKSFQFLRLPGLIFFGILTKFAGSPKARQRVWMYQWTDNGRTTVDHTIALLLGLVFSCMNPVVCIGALLYFFAVMLGEAYNNIYVFRRAYESAGRLWKTVYNQVMAGLYLTQIVMICLMLVKEFKWAILGVPLVCITLFTHITTLNMYNRPWSVMALADAAELDVWETEARMLDDKRKARAKPGAALRAEEAKLTPGGASGTPLALATGTGSGSLLEAGGLSGAASGGTPVSPTVLKNILSLDLELTPEERAAVADTYKNPSFKVPLEDLDSLIAQAEDLRHRVTLLNKYSVELQEHEKKEKKALAERKKQARREKRKLTPEEGQLAPYDPPPPEITLFDAKPPLDASDDD